MHQTEHLGACAVAIEADADEVENALQYRDARRLEPDGCAPRSPKTLRAHHGVEVPTFAAKARRQRPAFGMAVHSRRRLAEPFEPMFGIARIRLPARQPFESHRETVGCSPSPRARPQN